MSECMYQQNTSPIGCYYENKDHSVIFMECDTADCYYKQLKRLQAENEELKAQLDVLEEDNKKLSSENDALYNNSLQEVKEDLVKRVWNLQTENKELAHYLACMTEQRNKLKLALEEIREIVQKHIPVNIESFRKAEELPPVALGLQKILFKVEEVLK